MCNKKLSLFWSWLWRTGIFILLALFVVSIVEAGLLQFSKDFNIRIPFLKWLPYILIGVGILTSIIVAFYKVRSKEYLRFENMPKYPIVIFRCLIALFVTLLTIFMLNFLFWHIGWNAHALDYLYWRLLQPHGMWYKIINVVELVVINLNAFSLVGLFLFYRSARYWYVVTLTLYMLLGYLNYAYVDSGFEIVMLNFAYILTGAVIALSFVSPFRNYFLKEGIKNV